jgi:transglutaminase-like putative cysteine protease
MIFATIVVPSATAQISRDEQATGGPRYGEPDAIRYRVGAEITAKRGACRNIVATVAVPLECPEQQVEILSEEISPEVAEVTYRTLQGGANGGVRQMLISVPQLANGATARAAITLKVSSRKVLSPEKTDQLKIPQRIANDMRMYVNASPFIDVRHRNIVALSRETLAAVEEGASDWKKVEAIYDQVLEKVAYVEGPDESAVEALRDGKADCQGRSMLFIALCRANKIPARMVWVDGHAYPEFYLEESEGRGWWFPCESAGTRAFGEMPLARTILQKGDNFRVPERSTERLRYASDYMIGVPAAAGGGQPTCRFIREELGR